MKIFALSALLLAALSGGVWAQSGHHRNNQGHHGNGMNPQPVPPPAVVTNHHNGSGNQNTYQNGYQGHSGAAHPAPAHTNYQVQTYPLRQNQGHHGNSGHHPHR